MSTAVYGPGLLTRFLGRVAHDTRVVQFVIFQNPRPRPLRTVTRPSQKGPGSEKFFGPKLCLSVVWR